MGVSSDKILSHWSKNFHSTPDANCRYDLPSWFLAGLPSMSMFHQDHFSSMSYTTDVFLSVC